MDFLYFYIENIIMNHQIFPYSWNQRYSMWEAAYAAEQWSLP